MKLVCFLIIKHFKQQETLFLICSIPDDEKGFLLFEVFNNQEAHQLHSQGSDLQKLLQSMQEQNMRMEVMMMGGEEIESETQPILN